MVMKVKEPVAEEYHRLREGLVLFTYLHLAADSRSPRSSSLARSPPSPTRPCSCPRACCRCSTRCPRSPAASPQVGAHSMMKRPQGGRGVLMGGIGGVANSKVVVIGAGVAGPNAANIASAWAPTSPCSTPTSTSCA